MFYYYCYLWNFVRLMLARIFLRYSTVQLDHMQKLNRGLGKVVIVLAFFSIFKLFCLLLKTPRQISTFFLFQKSFCEYLREQLHYFHEHFVIFASSFRQNQKYKDEKFRSLEKV